MSADTSKQATYCTLIHSSSLHPPAQTTLSSLTRLYMLKGHTQVLCASNTHTGFAVSHTNGCVPLTGSAEAVQTAQGDYNMGLVGGLGQSMTTRQTPPNSPSIVLAAVWHTRTAAEVLQSH